MTVGERIKALREHLEISQVEFANMINVSKQTLYKYENNIITNIPSDKIEAVAKVGNVSPAYLMGWEEKQDSSFDFYLDMQLQLLGFSILYDSEGNVTLFHNKDSYEITDTDVKNLSSSVLSYIKFKLQEIMEQSRKYSTAREKIISIPKQNHSYLEPQAAHERTDVEMTDEMKQYDDALMDNDDIWK